MSTIGKFKNVLLTSFHDFWTSDVFVMYHSIKKYALICPHIMYITLKKTIHIFNCIFVLIVFYYRVLQENKQGSLTIVNSKKNFTFWFKKKIY